MVGAGQAAGDDKCHSFGARKVEGFNFIGGRFGESEYALMREQKDGRYVAILKAEKEFERSGKYIVACRVQDNLGGEAIKTKEFEID